MKWYPLHVTCVRLFWCRLYACDPFKWFHEPEWVENRSLKYSALEKLSKVCTLFLSVRERFGFLEDGNTLALRDLHTPSPPSLPCLSEFPQTRALTSFPWKPPSQEMRVLNPCSPEPERAPKHTGGPGAQRTEPLFEWLHFGFLWRVHLLLSFRTQKRRFSSKLWMAAAHLPVLVFLAFYL